MLPEALQEARDWLVGAERDLLIAERALAEPPVLAEQAAYHAQQAAEKALKGFLAAHDTPIPKSHHLEYLVSLCEPFDSSMTRFLPIARTLSPYATLFRYPGGPLEPEQEDAREAIRLATDQHQYVQGSIFAGGS